MTPYDVHHLNVSDPVHAPITGCSSHRHADLLDAVIDQFSVETNPRYTPRDTSGDGKTDTHCDAFVHDVTRALGAEVPNWWRGRELSANGMCDWLLSTGKHFGWAEARPGEALGAANLGRPAVAAWKNPAGSGHVAMVRPTLTPMTAMQLAQAGRKNLSRANLVACFGTNAKDVRFFIHD
jgi:hypothetical protein